MTQNTVAAQAGRKPQKKSQFSGMSRALVRRETISAYLFLLPSLIFFVTFVVVPMFICLFYSFTKYGLGGIKVHSGLENYIKLFQDLFSHGLPEYTDYRGGGGALCHRFLPVGEFRHL